MPVQTETHTTRIEPYFYSSQSTLTPRQSAESVCTSYVFGFNGKENDNEVKGTGNQQDYGMRIYDSRMGRFLSIDPLTAKFAFYTPYQFAGNTPIQAIDLDGGEPEYIIKNGKATPAVVTLLNLLVDFDIDNMNNTTYVEANNLPFGYEAMTAGTKVFYLRPDYKNSEGKYNKTSTYTDVHWIEMIGHEGKHRMETGDDFWSWQENNINYGVELLKNGYEDNKYEKDAYKIGYKDYSLIPKYLSENPSILNIIKSNASDDLKCLFVEKMYYEDLLYDGMDKLNEKRNELLKQYSQEQVDQMVMPIANILNSYADKVSKLNEKIIIQNDEEHKQ